MSFSRLSWNNYYKNTAGMSKQKIESACLFETLELIILHNVKSPNLTKY
jgi:hypothetical protein